MNALLGVSSRLCNAWGDKRSNLSGMSLMIEQIRTRISCSSGKGEEKSVKTAMERYFRIDKRVWIRAQPGYHHHLYLKPLEKRFLQQQVVLCGAKEAKMVERMSGKFYKKIKLNQFVDAPFSYYHPFLKQIQDKKPKNSIFPQCFQ